MSGRILRQYIEDYEARAQRTVRGQPDAKAAEAAANAHFKNISASKSKGKWRSQAKNHAERGARELMDGSLPQQVSGGLRMTKGSQDALAQARAYQESQIPLIRKTFDGKVRSGDERRAQEYFGNIAGAANRFLPNGLRFADELSFTNAQERKMLMPDSSSALVRQALSDEPEDRGLIGRFLGS